MKFFVYSINDFGKMEYVGTWFAECYANALQAIVRDTGLNLNNLKVFGHVT
jgi:hypothetical protein